MSHVAFGIILHRPWKEIALTLLHVILAIAAAVIVFALRRRFGGSKIHEVDHRQDRPSLEIVGDDLEQRTVNALHKAGKISAIKDLREATGWSLKEAKDYVDELERKYPLPKDLN